MNDICLFYISYAQQLQLFHLVLVYKKEAVFVPKSGQIVVKINGVNSSCKTGKSAAKSDMSQKEKSELEKGIK